MNAFCFQPNSIGLQCRKYKEIINAQTVSEWADILGVEFIDPSGWRSTFSVYSDPTKYWHRVGKAIAIHSNPKKLTFLIEMNNGEIAGLPLSNLRGMWHLAFLRKLIELEFGRTSALVCR
jgi:hypothetical protein